MESEIYETGVYTFKEINLLGEWLDTNIGTEADLSQHSEDEYSMTVFDLTVEDVEKIRAYENSLTPRTVFTFGIDHLKKFGITNGNRVMLVIDEDETTARNIVFNSAIGKKFWTSYPYYPNALDMRNRFNFKEITLDELLKLEIKK